MFKSNENNTSDWPDLFLELLGDTFPIDQEIAIRTMAIKTAL